MRIKAIDCLLLAITASEKEQIEFASWQATEYLRKKGLVVDSTPVFPQYSGEKEYKLTDKAMRRLSRAFGVQFKGI